MKHPRLVSTIFLLLVSACLAYGQGTVTIFGTVTDSSGGAIPSVAVTATNKDTGAARKASTGAVGDYVLSRLPIGT